MPVPVPVPVPPVPPPYWAEAVVPTARQNKTTPEIFPSDRENIVFFLSEIEAGQRIFPGSYSRNCAWLALAGCRVRAKKLSTEGNNIVSLWLKVQSNAFAAKMQVLASRRSTPSRTGKIAISSIGIVRERALSARPGKMKSLKCMLSQDVRPARASL
jgi:hypothetical protein